MDPMDRCIVNNILLAIFIGEMMKGLPDKIADEALLGLLFFGLAFGEIKLFHMFEAPSYLFRVVCIAIIGLLLIRVTLKNIK